MCMAELLSVPEPVATGTLRPRLFRVHSSRRELEDTWTLLLEPADGGAPLEFLPGQFTMLYAFGIGEVPISISGDAGHPAPLTHTVRVVGAVTRAICALRKGAMLGVRGPFGAPWPLVDGEGRDVLVVAGGIGLAPLRPAILSLIAARPRYERVAILVGARSPENLLFPEELERWRGRFDLEVRVTVDRAAREWRGGVGVVTQLIQRISLDLPRTVALVCGPEVMMRFTATELLNRGTRPESIFLSMERNMKCAVGLCGHCQFGPVFVCKDGPVFPYSRLEPFLRIREV